MDPKPTLVIMAAGMGSRYGGLKQIDKIDEEGDIIIDFSIFDAVKAGFGKIVFIIKHAIEKEFKEAIGDKIARYVDVEYVFQELDKLPEGYSVPEGREKPFGTGHAVLCAKNAIEGNFAVINADDFYGRGGFEKIAEYLKTAKDDDKYRYAFVGYELHNTLTENGYVSRGVCVIDENSYLETIHERTRIEKHGEDAEYTENDGKTWVRLPKDSYVSMNMWGFTHSILDELENRFKVFLDEKLADNPLKGEFFLPFVVDELLHEGKATAKMLPTPDVWHGVTYKEDKPLVSAAIKDLKSKGEYPVKLWE
ncbi:MAG: nucleotidyltransferase [Lachnospiraceae bacterium]|nr:nucleotidyltransferase [Lachnospiraceae bacterium]